MTPVENLRVPKQLGQGAPGEERGKGEGSPQSARRPLVSVLQLGAENALSQVWGQGECGRRGRQEGKQKTGSLDQLGEGKCAKLSGAVERGASK